MRGGEVGDAGWEGRRGLRGRTGRAVRLRLGGGNEGGRESGGGKGLDRVLIGAR